MFAHAPRRELSQRAIVRSGRAIDAPLRFAQEGSRWILAPSVFPKERRA